MNTTNYFNNQGLLTARTNNVYGQVTRMEYDIHDRVVETTDGNGIVLALKYDEYGRVTNKIDAVSVSILRYKYDAAGQLTNRWSAAKGDTDYSHDVPGFPAPCSETLPAAGPLSRRSGFENENCRRSEQRLAHCSASPHWKLTGGNNRALCRTCRNLPERALASGWDFA